MGRGGGGTPPTYNYILILKFKLIVPNVFFHSLQFLSGIQNESFIGRKQMNAAELRLNMEF